MPFEPPDPGRTLDALRAVLADVRAIAASRPGDPLGVVAVSALDIAVVAVTALACASPSPVLSEPA